MHTFHNRRSRNRNERMVACLEHRHKFFQEQVPVQATDDNQQDVRHYHYTPRRTDHHKRNSRNPEAGTDKLYSGHNRIYGIAPVVRTYRITRQYHSRTPWHLRYRPPGRSTEERHMRRDWHCKPAKTCNPVNRQRNPGLRTMPAPGVLPSLSIPHGSAISDNRIRLHVAAF